MKTDWLVVSTHLKTISQNGNLPQIGMEIKNIWNHHLEEWWNKWDPFLYSLKLTFLHLFYRGVCGVCWMPRNSVIRTHKIHVWCIFTYIYYIFNHIYIPKLIQRIHPVPGFWYIYYANPNGSWTIGLVTSCHQRYTFLIHGPTIQGTHLGAHGAHQTRTKTTLRERGSNFQPPKGRPVFGGLS